MAPRLVLLMFVLPLVGCQKFLASPRVTGTDAYTFSVLSHSEEITPGGSFVLSFSGRAPSAHGELRTAIDSATLQVLFDFGGGVEVACENLIVQGASLTCSVPSSFPEGTPTVRLVQKGRNLVLNKDGKKLVIQPRRSVAGTPGSSATPTPVPYAALTPPPASTDFGITSVVKQGTSVAGASVGDTLVIGGKGFQQFGPIQFYVGNDVTRRCVPKVESDTVATCVVPAGPTGNVAFWGEVLATPARQARASLLIQ